MGKRLVRYFVRGCLVLVPLALTPGGVRILGFVTRDALHALGMPEHVAVYFPQSYNFAGQLLVVPRDHVEILDVPSSEVMTFIVSGGISGFGRGQSLVPPPTLTSVNIKPL